MDILKSIAIVRAAAHEEGQTNRGTPLQCAALTLASEIERIYYSSPTAKMVMIRLK